jgi:hypothetical protein
MKSIITLLCAAALCGALAGCGSGGTGAATPSASPSAMPPTALKPTEYTDTDFDTSGDIVLKTEYDVYGADAPEISYTITNRTAEERIYGVAYSIEVRQNGAWYQVPFPGGTMYWIAVGIILEPNGTNADSFSLSSLDYTFSDGQYRLIKEIGDKRYFADFEIGASPITAETPFGYIALEKLPKEYTADTAAANGDVVVMQTEVKNAGKLTEFVRKAALGMPAMVRIVKYTMEGDPILTDIIYNENHRGYYSRRHDSSRDAFGGADTGISEMIYSYLITDGEGLYLSDCAGWEATEAYPEAALIQIAANGAFGDLGEAVAITGEMTAERMKWNIARYRVFSPDTKQNVALYGGLSYGFEGLSSSETREVRDPDGIATEITSVFWLDDNTFILICRTSGSLTYFHAVGNAGSGYGTGFTFTDGVFEIIE